MADNTVFDDVFKTLVTKMPQLLIPFVNEVFGRDYPEDARVEQLNDQRMTPGGARITDSVFRLRDRVYHVECQSTPDADMVLRMIEYDFHIALDTALGGGAPYEMNFPESCVLYLRHRSTTPDALTMKVNLPGGESFAYRTKVVKAQEITSDELFEKRLLILLPYYLMRYERALGAIDGDDARTRDLLAECADLRAGLEAATLAGGETLLYEELTGLIIRVTNYLLAAHETLQRKVARAMGGEVLELLHERAERLEREAWDRGLRRGTEQGLEQGLESIMAQLRAHGVDEALLQSAAEAARAEQAAATAEPERD